EFGAGLDGVLSDLKACGKLRGVLNGIDTERYDPATDTWLEARYTAANRSGKRTDRKALQQECGLTEQEDAPVLGLVSRLVAQKGLDLLSSGLEKILNMGHQ